MARIRTVKPEFWSDEKIGPLSPLTRLIFLGLVSQADDAGRLLDSPRLLNGILFPYTDDDCVESLDELAEVGVIRRGTTASGQPVIQICGWNKHQRIEKPNMNAALGAVAEESATRRRRIPDATKTALIERAEGRCEECNVEVKLGKSNKYDSSPNLAEIDHIVALADGGTDEPENLRLLCLSCNRRKAGRDLSARNRRQVGDASATSNLPDQRPTTNDQRSGSEERAARDSTPRPNERRLRELLPATCHEALRRVLLESHRGAEGAAQSMLQMLDPNDGTTGPGGRPVTPAELATALQQLAGMPNPGWNGGNYVRKAIQTMRATPSTAATPGADPILDMAEEIKRKQAGYAA